MRTWSWSKSIRVQHPWYSKASRPLEEDLHWAQICEVHYLNSHYILYWLITFQVMAKSFFCRQGHDADVGPGGCSLLQRICCNPLVVAAKWHLQHPPSSSFEMHSKEGKRGENRKIMATGRTLLLYIACLNPEEMLLFIQMILNIMRLFNDY